MRAEDNYDHVFKLVLVGDSGVGKSSLVNAFTDGAFHSAHVPTIGVDFKIRSLSVDGASIKMHLWDTTGHERFRAITTSYYRVAHGIAIVYDATNASSFKGVSNWLETVQQFASEGVTIVLMGTKCDLTEARQVSHEQAEAIAARHGVMHVETCATSPALAVDAFGHVAVAIKRRQAELAVQRREAQRSARASRWPGMPAMPHCDDAATCSCLPPIFSSLFSNGPAWAPVASS